MVCRMLEKMDDFFENRLEGYDQHMRTNIQGAGEFYRFTAEHLPMQPGCQVLDLGCGTGLELEEYFALNPTAQVTGVDLSAAMLRALEGKFPGKALRLVHGSYFDVPFGKGEYAGAVSVESLHHFTQEQKLPLYQKLCQALAPGGWFVLTDYFAESPQLERQYFQDLERLKEEQRITDGGFYHYDTPLTLEHEVQVLERAGFSRVDVLKNWEATYTLQAFR